MIGLVVSFRYWLIFWLWVYNNLVPPKRLFFYHWESAITEAQVTNLTIKNVIMLVRLISSCASLDEKCYSIVITQKNIKNIMLLHYTHLTNQRSSSLNQHHFRSNCYINNIFQNIYSCFPPLRCMWFLSDHW